MKKLILCIFAFMLTGSLLFAQSNSSNVTQSGSQHKSIINQNSGFGSGHTAELSQQSGDLNFADVLQDQANAEAYITQTGSENESRTKQSGYNLMNVLQEGEFNVLGGYSTLNARAYQKNGTGLWASDMNTLDLDQLGDYNEAGLWQEHHGEASVLQSGVRNEALVSQSGATSGGLNEVAIAQHGSRNLADAYQRGEGNKANIQQGIGSYFSNDNTANVTQTGDGNEAYATLEWGGGTEVDINHNGDDNYSEFSVKYGSDNAFTADVGGSSNKTRFLIAPDWGSVNKISVKKLGNGNNIAGYISGHRNLVDVVQEGDFNNVGTSWNTGDGVNLKGVDNNVSVAQMSNSNTSFSSVTGHYNSISVMQN